MQSYLGCRAARDGRDAVISGLAVQRMLGKRARRHLGTNSIQLTRGAGLDRVLGLYVEVQLARGVRCTPNLGPALQLSHGA